MFTPIKNFITYIQNAGSNGMFGAAATTTATTTTTTTTSSSSSTTNIIPIAQISTANPTLAIAKSINTICKETTPTLTINAKKTNKLTEIQNKMEEENIIKSKILTIPEEHIIEVTLEEEEEDNMPLSTIVKTTTTINTNNVNNNNNNYILINGNNNNVVVDNTLDVDDDDDIELQIKSSIMVKPSVLNGDKLEKNNKPNYNNNTGGLRHTRTIMRRPSISGPGPILNEEPMKFIPPLGLGKIVDRDKIIINNKNITTNSICRNAIANINVCDVVEEVEKVVPVATAGSTIIEDVLNTSFESALEDDSFLEVSLPEIPNSEIIVLNCLESCSPTTTTTPTEDPINLDNSLNSLDNQRDNTNSFNDSINSNDEINIEVVVKPAVHETETDVDAGTCVYWLNVDTDGIDVCDNNNLSVDAATSSQESNNLILQNDNTKANLSITTTRHEHLEEGRNEGSDSGLGVEAAQVTKLKDVQAIVPSVTHHELQEVNFSSTTTTTTTSSSSTLPHDPSNVTNLRRPPLRSNLKRRLETSELKPHTATNSSDVPLDTVEKRPKRSINFDTVKVYYFSRQQGFNCVPSAGGCTLGMSSQHHGFKIMTLAEHAAELRRAHRMQLQEINPRASSSDDSEESEEDFLSEGSGSDLDAETNGFLQPVTPKQRRALLKAAGVRKIDASEKIECRDIRNSREVCGCTCRDFCDPETCACSQAGIKCQVDRAMFPCGCTRDACGNTVGRVEFNPARVRTHFIHTIMRLKMENRQQQQPLVNIINNNNNNNSSSLNNYAHMSSPSHYYNTQTQSNYSSGYASPAYTNEHGIDIGNQSPATNYYAHQTHVEQHHYMSGNGEIHHQANNYQIDSLDAGLYPTPHNNMQQTTTTYGDLTSSVAITPYGNNAHYNTTTNFAETVHSKSTSPYGSCFMPQSNHNYTSERNPAPQQQNFSIANATSSPICTFICAPTNTGSSSYANEDIIGDTGGTASFIDISPPVANATRLLQINDMLQQNRHTTATLVTVTPNTAGTIAESMSIVTGMHATSPPPSPTSSTTISVEHDDTSNISVINNIEEAQTMNICTSSTRLQACNFENSKEIKLDILNSKEMDLSSSSLSIIAVHKEQNLH